MGTLKGFAKGLGDIPVQAIAAITAIGGIEYSLFRMAQTMVDTATKFNIFEAATGLSSQELQKWQRVAERVGVSGDAVAGSIQAIQRNLASLPYNPGMIKPFAFLHINPIGKNVFQILGELRKNLGTMPRSQFSYWANQIGLADEMLRVLELNDKQFTEFMNHARGMTPGMVSDFEKLRQQLSGISQSIRDFGFEYLDKLLSGLEKMPSVIAAIGVAIAGLLVYMSPLAAAITVILALISDLMVASQGGKTMTGSAIGKIQSWGEEKAKEMGRGDVMFPKIKSFGDWMDAHFLPSSFQQPQTSTGTATNVTMHFHGLFDSKENMLDAAMDATKRHIGLNTRVQINNNATKRQQ